MSARKSVLLALFAIVVLQVSAEEVRSTNIRVYSENQQYYANISKMTNVVEVKIYKRGQEFELWANWVEWERGLVELVSDDGRYFILLNNNYSDRQNLVTIYSRLKQEAYSVRSISIAREYLKNESGKLRWIEDVEKDIKITYGEDSKAASLEIRISDGRILSIDLH